MKKVMDERDLSLRWISDGYPILHHTPGSQTFRMQANPKKISVYDDIFVTNGTPNFELHGGFSVVAESSVTILDIVIDMNA